VSDTEQLLAEAVRLLERWKDTVPSWSVSYGLADDTFNFMQAYRKRSEPVSICRACIEAVANGAQGEEAHQEYGCKGKTHCDCQHRVGSIEEFVNPQAVAQMRASGLLPGP
jgi:hypothetical protein